MGYNNVIFSSPQILDKLKYSHHLEVCILFYPHSLLSLHSLQVPSPTGIANSFKKLMRACSPSSQSGPSESGYMTAIQESLWMDQLSLLMQLAGAVADLIDIQGSSVLVCLENGWDTTAQVRILSDVGI